jgi:hypothetical protein
MKTAVEMLLISADWFILVNVAKEMRTLIYGG